MVSRAPGPGGYRWLSWGESTEEPRSVVRDAVGAMVFPGSPVERVLPPAAGGPRPGTGVSVGDVGRVVELVSETVVRVQWEAGVVREVVSAEVRVTGPFVLDERKR